VFKKHGIAVVQKALCLQKKSPKSVFLDSPQKFASLAAFFSEAVPKFRLP